jgi:branched-chain amino acid transport system ATP-binding protein
MRQARERASHLLREFKLENDAEIEAERLIHGDQKRLETMLALALEPEILLLDEPASGADEEGVAAIMELIKVVSTDRTILLTDHDIRFVMGVADRITVLDQGKIIAEGSGTEIAQNKMVQEAYLGVAIQ